MRDTAAPDLPPFATLVSGVVGRVVVGVRNGAAEDQRGERTEGEPCGEPERDGLTGHAVTGASGSGIQ